ncbi:competence protein CoiA [Enterococcus caccae]|uniref:Competence protein CoiA n=1 Tax=Enterococcus caccae ATCC BAA-1240 TaxID=1158612 RepID=R3W866_9ENTE|nr:competence protein CoiA family protein [Enterococcus caccae]EOL43702.1 hypothetical protein UC7_03032 [Enterococcus caccae ATCC BAA-1240]EOT67898.1 hypothetical protein I580_00280 [Enterococcus caccae ATCC BAA-1240]OJG28613.1 hypothetical protein RU98_GL000206 [Enterococcus caccae]
MLNAYSKNKKIITLLNLSREEIEQLKSESYFCPACGHPVQIKNGKVKVPHFSHYKKSTCSLYSEGETVEHLSLKKMFANWCEEEGISYELEKYLPALNQRPDLLIGNIAVEIQCSALSITRLVERTNTYQKNGYTPLWICGKKLVASHQILNELAKNLCYYSENLGFYLWTADWEQAELALYFHIEEDWKKRPYASKKAWTFYSEPLMKILHFPSQGNIHVRRKYKMGNLIQDYYTDLNRKLYRRDKKIRLVQSTLYNKRFHLIQLPNWFYFPGLHIFCCRGSDLLLKVQIWKLVQFFDQNVISHLEIIQAFENEIEESRGLFYELPNIPFQVIKIYCLNRLLDDLIKCNHLVKVQTGWKFDLGNPDQSVPAIIEWLKRIENKCLITATPFKNMIR